MAGTARSALSGHGPLLDKWRRCLPVPDDSPGCISLEEPPERLASGAHPFLGVWPVHAVAPGDADVFPRRPTSLAPIMQSLPTEQARTHLIAVYDHDLTEPEWALGYRWDIVVRGPHATPFETL